MRLGITGHQQLPDGVHGFVVAEARSRLGEAADLVVVTSLAAGTDQVIADVALGLGGGLEVVVPCEGYESTFTDAKDLASYRRLLANAARIAVLAFDEPSEAAFMAAGRVVADRSDELIAVWDGEPAKGLGGTADIVRYASERGVPVVVLWPEGVVR